MNTFKSVCANCHGLLDVPTAYIGKHVKCTNCGEDFVAEPNLGTTVKAPKIAKSSKLRKSDMLKNISISGFSLRVDDKELIFYRYCNYVGLFSIVIAALVFVYWLYLIVSSGGDSQPEIVSLGKTATFASFLSLMVSGALHLGAAQIIRLFHSMAYNIQAIKEGQNDTH